MKPDKITCIQCCFMTVVKGQPYCLKRKATILAGHANEERKVHYLDQIFDGCVDAHKGAGSE